MPKFRWSGATSRGQKVSGEIEAHSKEDVLSRLRGQSITVSSVEESRSGGEPEDPDRLYRAPVMPPAPTSLDPPKPRRFLAFLFAPLYKIVERAEKRRKSHRM